MLNADIVAGPGTTDEAPVDPARFLSLCGRHQPGRILSLGWTTAMDSTTTSVPPNSYQDEHVRPMADLVASVKEANVTFPVRAAMAVVGSRRPLEWLLSAKPFSTLTVWSAKEDDVSGKELARFVEAVGRDRVYVDVPEQLDMDMRNNFNQ